MNKTFISYFNLPFDVLLEPKELLYKFEYFQLTNFEKGYLKDILSLRKIANINYKDLNLEKDDNPDYNNIAFFDVEISNNTNLVKITTVLCKIIKYPCVFIFYYNNQVHIACGNVNYFKNEINLNKPIKYVSSSIDIKNLTYSSRKFLEKINLKQMNNLYKLYDYIFNIVFAITNNMLKFIKVSTTIRYMKFILNDTSIANKISKEMTIKCVGKFKFFESEEAWRIFTIHLQDTEKLKCYESFNDIKNEIKNQNLDRQIRDKQLDNVNKSEDEEEIDYTDYYDI